MLLDWWNWLFGNALHEVDQEARFFWANGGADRPDWKCIVVLVSAAIVLTMQYYWGSISAILPAFRWLNSIGLGWLLPVSEETLESWQHYHFPNLVWWAILISGTYLVIPMLTIVLILREPLADYGLKLQGFLNGWVLYLIMIAIMAPILLWVSTWPNFQAKYPFYPFSEGESIWPYFLCWEMLYALQFIALEFFFRGYLLHGTKHRFGSAATFVMVVPYCMIHFGKPMAETLGAIIAGTVLGFMSLKTRSIWLGAALHIAVAWSMDWLVIWRKGFLR